jgi:hypothetical protein
MRQKGYNMVYYYLDKNGDIQEIDGSEFPRLPIFLDNLPAGQKFTTRLVLSAMGVPKTHHTMVKRRLMNQLLLALGCERIRDAKNLYWIKPYLSESEDYGL